MASTVPTTSKRALNLAERIAVIQQYEKNQNKNHLARAFNCCRAQITNILRHKDEYLAEFAKHKDPTRVRRGRSVELAFLGMVVHEWVMRCRSFGVVVTDDLLRNIGTKVAELINYRDFRSTNRWLDRFKGKYKLTELDLLQPSNDQVDKGDLTDDSLVLENIIKDLKDQNVQIYGKSVNFSIQPKINSGLKQYGKKQQIERRSDSYDSSSANLSALNVLQFSMNECGSDGGSSSNNLGEDQTEITVKMEDISQDLEDEENIECARQIESYKQALNHLGPLEQFVLMREDIRSIGLINQLENLFREKMINMN